MGNPFLDTLAEYRKKNEELRVFVADLKAENKQLSDELNRLTGYGVKLRRKLKKISEIIEGEG